MKNKKTLFIIAGVALAIIIAVACYFIFFNKPGEINAEVEAGEKEESNITIKKYTKDNEIEKEIAVKNKKDIKKLKELCGNAVLEENEDTKYLAIKTDIKIELDDGTIFVLSESSSKNCYYENKNDGTKLIIEIPEGLFDFVNSLLK